MSHSYRKPYATICHKCRKDKKRANRLFRRRTKTKLAVSNEILLPTRLKEVSDVWWWRQDGKQMYVGEERRRGILRLMHPTVDPKFFRK